MTSRDNARRKANDAMILVEKTFQHNLEKMAEVPDLIDRLTD